MTWDVVVGYLTTLRLYNPDLDPGTLLRTVLVLHLCDAVLCRLFAHNNGYSKNLWTGLGFVFGLWSVALLLMLPKRSSPPQ
ncbi:MAG: hypothetical protein ACRERC_05570 [Candidatus Binatia bacterium]